MHAINGGTKLRGLAHEQANSEDPNMANHAQEAVALAEDTPRAKRVVIDEDGVMVDDQVKVPKGEARLASGHSNGAGHDRLAEELRSEILRCAKRIGQPWRDSKRTCTLMPI